MRLGQKIIKNFKTTDFQTSDKLSVVGLLFKNLEHHMFKMIFFYLTGSFTDIRLKIQD